MLVLLATTVAQATSIDYRATYPDSCPNGTDVVEGLPSRLCLPSWKADYSMSRSTIIMPCNTSGTLNVSMASQYGLVDIDWSNAKHLWANSRPMDCEERLVEQAKNIKKANPDTKVWVYRNLVKALPWYTSVREKLCDPAYEGWFLKFDPRVEPHVPKCDDNYDPPKCTEFYHDQKQTPSKGSGTTQCNSAPCDCGCVPCGEYLWDHRNQSLRAWLADEHVGGASAVGNQYIDGVFTDDEWRTDVDPDDGGGPSEEDKHSVEDMGLSKQDVQELIGNWTLAMRAAQQKVLDLKGFAWRLFVPGSSTGGSDPVGGKSKCVESMRKYCVPNSELHKSAMMMSAGKSDSDFMPNLAGFLLIRGPYAWFGNAWQGCNKVPTRRAEIDVDYGMPVDDQCKETEPGVFEREWTKARVQLDCNAWTANITMKQQQ